MNKKSLKLIQFYNLESELNGVKNQNGDKLTKGLLSEKIQLKTKYWLLDLYKKTKEQTDACSALRDELIKKHGEEIDGVVSITPLIEEDGKKVVNPKFLLFQDEFNALLNEEREIEYKELSLEDLGSLETAEVYETLFSLLKS